MPALIIKTPTAEREYKVEETSPKIFWKTFTGLIILISALALYQTVQRVLELDVVLWRSKWIFPLGLFALNFILGFFALKRLSSANGNRWIEKLEIIPGNKLLGLALVAIGFSLTWLARLFLFGNILPQTAPIFWVFLWASILQVLGLKLITGRQWHVLFALVILAQGVIYKIYGHLTIVTDYPFSIGYSEASRHYYASMFFSERLYGLKLPLPFLHPTRYFLLSLPFIVEGLPLWFHRMWQALLWIGLTAASASLLSRRLHLNRWMSFFVAAWAFLFFLQGAVYYHLQVCVILILAGVSARNLKRSFIFILLASIWAGASRVNWFPVPAMLAIAIYILETPVGDKGWRYWVTPILWGVCGVGFAVASQFIYISISGNADNSAFGSSFTSDLLWNRLLPNETYSLGVLPGLLFISVPLLFAMAQMLRKKTSHLHPLRWLALLALLTVLFLGGLVVSTKIGGGGDLHNLDAFLVMLALITSSFFAERVVGEEKSNPAWGQIRWPVTVAAMLIPIGFAIPQIRFVHSYDHVLAEKDIRKLQQVALEAANNGGEVLFVTERQLLTFDELKNIPLTPDYEQIELMEMAMSGNRDYLKNFYADLHAHRFAIIIAKKQKSEMKKRGAFMEEDNAWVRYVGAPLLCEYYPIDSLELENIQIFIPRSDLPACKDPFSE
ncbi:MAG: hypothetical protein HY864_05665 [Chloroflexi bacterium]|nr:hypothetical protein [Chloroflexota bacterium]